MEGKTELKIIYQRYADLVYHVLAHIPLDNAADEYDAEYVRTMKEQLGRSPAIPKKAAEWYREHFDRVCLIGFMPFVTGGTEECLAALRGSGMMDEADMEHFALPFFRAVEEEKDAYYAWWEKKQAETEDRKPGAEKGLREFIRRFDGFFGHYDRITVILSHSLQRNGRMFMNPGGAFLYLKFPGNEAGMEDIRLQLLHECTHPLTDPKLGNDIRMDDGSHDLAEYQVFLYDEFLIERKAPELLERYRDWIGREWLEEARRALTPERTAMLKEMACE